ncbi:hypothetical protein L7F22_002620 [Adiantum nelumboides]|nr:hypothetical protein [Adiantum nelumboides]
MGAKQRAGIAPATGQQRVSTSRPWGSNALRSASSSVTVGGHVGRTFRLSRSVRQGCPLAPYLFLLVAETMSDFIRAQQPALRGLLMPVADEPDLIDQEYADDTLLFLHHSHDVLDAIQYALELFCVASGARINWNKSYGILAGADDIPTWGPGDFKWLRPGQTCRYLGFQVGLDVTPEQQFSSIMQSMRRKLCYWSTQHLSLAGRALVANQVLLASAWYVASCWTLHGGVMRQLRRLIRNFLYEGLDGTHDTRARVRWSTVIMPTSQGGLGIIDPEMQSRALLTKLIVRGLFPGNEPCKMLLQSDLATVTPTYGVRDGHIWTRGMRFLFIDAPRKLPITSSRERSNPLFHEGEMAKCDPPPSRKLSKYAPLIVCFKVEPEKVNSVIGSGGKTVRSIIEQSGVDSIDLEDDGSVRILAKSVKSLESAKSKILGLTMDPVVGTVYRDCPVKSIVSFGCFLEIAPGREGLCHISELSTKRLEKVEDMLSIGDKIDVKLIETNTKGQIRLSHRVLIAEGQEADAEELSSVSKREQKDSQKGLSKAEKVSRASKDGQSGKLGKASKEGRLSKYRTERLVLSPKNGQAGDEKQASESETVSTEPDEMASICTETKEKLADEADEMPLASADA